MIDERSPVIRRSAHQHFQYDRFLCNPYPNPNPSPKLSPRQYVSKEWIGADEASRSMSVQREFYCQQKEQGLKLASFDTGFAFSQSAPCPSGSALYVVPASGEIRGGCNRFKARAFEFPSSGGAANMRDTYNRTKVVVRRLPPALSESAFMEEIATRFSAMYNMVSFCPGKSSIKGSSFSRAYINFKHPEDVIDFFEGFNGHLFVNEKGTQYRALVEYAPNQRVPNSWPKKDPKEGSIFQDPNYMKFNEEICKPVEYLPSAEAQLERKETERMSNSGMKEAILVTPLMEFVRQKRALKSMPQKSLASAGKLGVRGGALSMAKMVLKRGADRSRANSMYTPGSRSREKASYVPRHDDSQRREILADKKGRVVLEAKDSKILLEDSTKAGSSNQGTSALNASIEQGIGKGFVPGKKNSGGFEKEELIINGFASGNSGSLANGKSAVPAGRGRVAPASAKGSAGSFSKHQTAGVEGSSLTKASQCIASGGQVSSKGASSSRSPVVQKTEQQNDQDKRFSRAQVWKTSNRDAHVSDLESGSMQFSREDKNDTVRQDGRRLRNKDRPDRPVWTVRQRSDATDFLTNPTVAPSISPPGNQRQGRGPRDIDNTFVPETSKPPSKRAGSSMVYGHEKQIWVAKPGSGS